MRRARSIPPSSPRSSRRYLVAARRRAVSAPSSRRKEPRREVSPLRRRRARRARVRSQPPAARADAPLDGRAARRHVTIVRQTDRRGAARRRGVVVPRRARPPDDDAERPGRAHRADDPAHARRRALPLADAIAANGGSVRFNVDRERRALLRRGAARGRAPPSSRSSRSGARVAGLSSAHRGRGARARVDREFAHRQQVALQVGLDMLGARASPSANAGCRNSASPASLAQLSAKRRARVLRPQSTGAAARS